MRSTLQQSLSPEDGVVYSSAIQDMALRNDDKEWVRTTVQGTIDDAIDGLKPHGWRKAVTILRELGPLAATIAVIVALLGITLGSLYQSFGHVKEETQFRTHTDDRLDEVEKRLSSIETSLFTTRTAQLADKPTDKKSAAEVKTILQTAKNNSVRLPQDVVEQSGKAFIDAASKEPVAWDAALQFLDYRSFLNAQLTPPLPSPQPFPLATYKASILFRVVENGEPHQSVQDAEKYTTVLRVGNATPENSARLELIGQQPEPQGSGAQFVVLEMKPEFSGTVSFSLDGQLYKNVVIRSSTIMYAGGSVSLENVYFVNCKFLILQTSKGPELARAILSTPAITVKLS